MFSDWSYRVWCEIGCDIPWREQGEKLVPNVLAGRSVEQTLEAFWVNGIQWLGRGEFQLEKVWRFNAVADGLVSALERIQG